LSDYVRRTEEAVAAVEPTGNERVLAKVVAAHGGALREAGRAAEGATALERAVGLARAAADPWQEGWCRNHLGFTWVLGPMPAAEALSRCDEQLSALEWGPPGPIGLWAAMGVLHSQLGDASSAERLGTLAVEAAREAGLRFELAWTRTWLAAALEPFDPDEAETHLRRAHDLLSAQEQDPDPDLAWVGAEIARHAIRRNVLAEGEALLAAARHRLRGDLIQEQVVFHHAAALLEERRGNASRALELVRRSVAFAREADDIHRLAIVLETLARLDPPSRALEEAETLYERKGDVLALARIRGAAAPPDS
jgi:tetratricopeptide (TPR) repeat protein